jgi:tRNA(Ile)-lysidine synthase
LLVLAVVADCEVVAHHVDHGLRVDSGEDVQVVAKLARALGVEVVVHSVFVGSGPNLEARARSARLAVLPKDVATGHTADDQAETVLLNLLRGAATEGLAGMRLGPRHPILGLRRAETHALCDELELAPVRDPTNLDPAHLRNRVRHELIPMLCELAGRDVVPVLARQAKLLADDAAFLSELAGALDPSDAKAVAAAPAPVSRRAVRAWLRGDHPPDLATVERVLAVASGAVLAAEVGAGRTVRRSKGRLRLEPPAREAANGGQGLGGLSDSPGR